MYTPLNTPEAEAGGSLIGASMDHRAKFQDSQGYRETLFPHPHTTPLQKKPLHHSVLASGIGRVWVCWRLHSEWVNKNAT